MDDNGTIVVVHAERRQGTTKYFWEDDVFFSRIDNRGVATAMEKPRGTFRDINRDFFDNPSRNVAPLANGKLFALLTYGTCSPDMDYINAVIFDENGEITAIDTARSAARLIHHQLVADGRGNAYVIAAVPWALFQVYPTITRTGPCYFQRRVPANDPGPDFAAIATNAGHFLICSRVEPDADATSHQAISCCIVDVNGGFVARPKRIDLVKKAFRKIRSSSLPGFITDGKLYRAQPEHWVDGGLDLTRIHDGTAVLSVSMFDEADSLCIYQVRFSGDGSVVSPKAMEIVWATPFMGRAIPSGAKSGILRRAYCTNMSISHVVEEQVFWGFDNLSRFYLESVPLFSR